MTTPTIKISCTVEPTRTARGKRSGFRAVSEHGNLVGYGDTITLAKQALASGIEHALELAEKSAYAELCLFAPDGSVWQLRGNLYGWSYEITRRGRNPTVPWGRSSICARYKTRDEAVGAMQAHYFSVYVLPFAEVIASLNGYVCKRCDTCGSTSAGYTRTCQSPACGAALAPEEPNDD